MRLNLNLILIVISLWPSGLFARDLTKTEVFHRCYGQITQSRPARNHPLLAAVKNSTMDPIVACMNVLNSALLTDGGNTRIGNTSDTEALNVIKTFNNLHKTWSSVVDIYPGEVMGLDYSNDYFDSGTSALYFTRALFHPSLQASSVVTSNETLIAVRSIQDPGRGPASTKTKAETAFGPSVLFAPMGTLFGVQPLTSRVLSVPGGPTVDIAAHFGGGGFGTQSFLLLNVDTQALHFKSDGAVKMPRKWARSVYKDFLCRDLPVVRDEDATNFVVSGSPTPFRNTNTCTKCHVSMDRMSSNIRGFRYQSMYVDPFNIATNAVPVFARMETPMQPQEPEWPTTSDANYYLRPPSGTLYYRSHNGQLVNDQTTSLQDLGNKIALRDDIYNCWAKRYYQYFTGVGSEIGDIADPKYGRTLNALEMTHRNRVISLGQSFRSHQNPRQLIQDILSLPQYQTSNQGL